MISQPFYLAGSWEESEDRLNVIYPATGEVVGETSYASPEQLEQAATRAAEAFEVTRRLPTDERSRILREISAGIAARRKELARIITLESGKPIRDAAVEVDRAVFTFQTAAEEAKRIGGEFLPLDLLPFSRNRVGITRRFPLGPVVAITPFNFPLNLGAHKVAPALAAGNTVVLKPPSKTPLTWLYVAGIIDEAGLPPGAVSVLPMRTELAERMVADERFRLLTFTGSNAVGWHLKDIAGKKRVLLELGGNAGVIVDRGADLAYAASRIVVGAFSYAGQVCISVQRVYVHRDHYDELAGEIITRAAALKIGDPLDPATDLGPMVEESALARTEEWVAEAVAEGARVLTGGKRLGRAFEPTVLTEVSPQSKVCRMEVFAPVVSLFPFEDFRDAVAQVNDSPYGLQAGVFTSDLEHAWYAFDELQVGGVIVNDIPNYRIDPMPYGGTKSSGLGREGLKYAIEEMTELKLMVLNRGLGLCGT